MSFKKPRALRPGNRYARETGAGRTLAQLVLAKMALVAICRRCKHRRVLYPANLIFEFGEDFPAIQLRDRLRCSKCRYRFANLHESAR
jgi:DNA-directed RNA polymerase subunit RPC12/RpoP